MGTGTFLPTEGRDPVADLARQEGTVANTTSFANANMGPGPGQALAQAGVNNTAAEQAFQDFLNNSLTNVQTANNKFGGNNGGTGTGTGGFSTGFTGSA